MSEIYVDIYRVFIPHTMLLVVSSYHYEKCNYSTLRCMFGSGFTSYAQNTL